MSTLNTKTDAIISNFIYRFQDLTVDQFRDIRAKAGGLILLMPQNITELNPELRQVCISIFLNMDSMCKFFSEKSIIDNWINPKKACKSN